MENEWKIIDIRLIGRGYGPYHVRHNKCDRDTYYSGPFQYFCMKCKNRAPDWILTQVSLLNEQ